MEPLDDVDDELKLIEYKKQLLLLLFVDDSMNETLSLQPTKMVYAVFGIIFFKKYTVKDV